jgi:hypothetical protein
MTPRVAIVVAVLCATLAVEATMVLVGLTGRGREPTCLGDARLVKDRGDCTPWRMTPRGEERECRLVCVRGSR